MPEPDRRRLLESALLLVLAALAVAALVLAVISAQRAGGTVDPEPCVCSISEPETPAAG